jgi:hypothetical protein
MNREKQCDRMVRHIFGSVIRDIADFDPVFSTTSDVNNVESDSQPGDHFAVSEFRRHRFADRNFIGHHRGSVRDLVRQLALDRDRHEFDSGAGQQSALQREIGVMRIKKVDALVLHDRWVKTEATLQDLRTQNVEVLISHEKDAEFKMRFIYVLGQTQR